MQKQKLMYWGVWIMKLVIAGILLQTLSFKFTAHPQAVELFTQLDLFGLGETNGRIGVGVVELVASILLLVPTSSIVGALGVIALMAGAIYFHITILGFSRDDGQLFVMAIVALILGVLIFIYEFRKRTEIHETFEEEI